MNTGTTLLVSVGGSLTVFGFVVVEDGSSLDVRESPGKNSVEIAEDLIVNGALVLTLSTGAKRFVHSAHHSIRGKGAILTTQTASLAQTDGVTINFNAYGSPSFPLLQAEIGAVILGGRLIVNLNTQPPSGESTYILLTGTSVVGTFESISVRQNYVPSGGCAEAETSTQSTSNAVTLTITQTCIAATTPPPSSSSVLQLAFTLLVLLVSLLLLQ